MGSEQKSLLIEPIGLLCKGRSTPEFRKAHWAPNHSRLNHRLAKDDCQTAIDGHTRAGREYRYNGWLRSRCEVELLRIDQRLPPATQGRRIETHCVASRWLQCCIRSEVQHHGVRRPDKTTRGGWVDAQRRLNTGTIHWRAEGERDGFPWQHILCASRRVAHHQAWLRAPVELGEDQAHAQPKQEQ